MRAAGEQAKTACGNLQLCTGLEAGIEGATHALGQWRLARVREMRENTEDKASAEVEEEEEGGGIVSGLYNLNIETGATVEEAEDCLAEALVMEVKEEGAARARKRVEGLNGHWKALSSSLRNLSRAELRSLMHVMGLSI